MSASFRLVKLQRKLAAYKRWDKTDCNIFSRTKRHWRMAVPKAEIEQEAAVAAQKKKDAPPT